MKSSVIAAAAIALGLYGAQATAASLNITGLETDVTVTANLTGLGLAPSTFGTATAAIVGGQLVTTFPITGGALDLGTGDALIEHDGSGVTLTALADPSLSVTVGNFLIDTNAGLISGDVIGGASGVPFFTLGAPTAQGLTLGFTTELAAALTSVFGAPDLEGETFGFGSPVITTAPVAVPVPVPVPAAFAMMATAAVGLGALGARRRAG